MSKAITKKRVLELIAECHNTANDLMQKSVDASQEGKFVERERQWARSRKFTDVANALGELLSLRKARRSTTKYQESV